MITLITGEPGNGKTALAISQILEECRKSPRPLFLWGIKDVNLAYQVAPPVEFWTHQLPIKEDPDTYQYYFCFPARSLLVVDECQNIYRVRSSSAKVPPHVSALETHRHTGIDIWLITQKPHLIDPNVRQLIGKHIHLRSKWSGRKLYEWGECRPCLSRTDLAEATSRDYKLPTHVFTLYSSATAHLKVSRRLPKQFYIIFLLIGLFALAATHVGMRLKQALSPTDETTTDHEAASVARGSVSDTARSESAKVVTAPISNLGILQLVSYAYLRAGDKVITRYWIAEDDKGVKRKIDGDLCTGEGADAKCIVDGQLVKYVRKKVETISRPEINTEVSKNGNQKSATKNNYEIVKR